MEKADSEKISGCQGLGEGGVNRWSSGLVYGSETALCDAIMVDARHYAFVQNHRMYNTKSESQRMDFT